jgi:hypothetical protein
VLRDRPRPAWWRAVAGWFAAVAILAWFQGAAVLRSLENTLTWPFTNGDALQQIFPFFRYTEPAVFASDYIAEYYITCFYPVGYWGLYASLAKLGIDPTELSRVLPHVTWLTTVVLLGAAANKLGGKLAALCAMALVLGSSVVLYRTAGGLPRSFGFPILSGTVAALAYGRVGWCAVCVCLGALFYPVVAVISGFSLAGMLLFPRFCGLSERSWSLKRRFGFLTAVAALAALILLPSTFSSSRYGELVRPADVRTFPEAGAGGRYDSNSRPPFKGFFAAIPGATEDVLPGGAPPWSESGRARLESLQSGRHRSVTYGLFVLGFVGAASLLVRLKAARRVLMFGIAAGLGYTLASFAAPYAFLPERYVSYPVPLLLTLCVSTVVAGLLPRSFNVGLRRWFSRIAVACQVTAVLWLLGGRVPQRTGLTVDLRAIEPVTNYIASLPPNVVIAGWPKGPINIVPHVARRKVLLSYETHQAFHSEFVLEMRRRMLMLTDAYFATSVDPIIELREELGVTHLLIERSHFAPASHLWYFRPFGNPIKKRREAARGKSFELPRLIREASVVSFEDYELLDLTRIHAREPPDGEAEPPARRRRKTRQR